MKTILSKIRQKWRPITTTTFTIDIVTLTTSKGDLIKLSTIETIAVCVAITLLSYIGAFAYYYIKNLCSRLWQSSNNDSA